MPRPEGHEPAWGDVEKNVPGRRHSKCKGPEMGMSLVQLRKRKAWKGLGLKIRFKVAEPNCESLGRDCGFYYMCRGKPLRQVSGRPAAWVWKEGSLGSTLSLYRVPQI